MNNQRSLALTTGLALFCMFFGSGNLVFPLLVGTQSGDNAVWATLGLSITAVLVPLLGCIGIMLYNGQLDKFFRILGSKGFFIFAFASLALMGPFGVLARCLTVAYGTFAKFHPEISLIPFSLVSCALLFVSALWRDQILQLLGKWLTPALLGSLVAIFLCSFFMGFPEVSQSQDAWSAFSLGTFQGYQTMDLLAAFFFSGFIIVQLAKDGGDSTQRLRVFLQASLIAGLLLATVYAGLVYLGVQHSEKLTSVPPEMMLATVATLSMGNWGGAVVCIAFGLACYTTAIVLTVLFADFLRKDMSKGKIPQWASLSITLGIAFAVSTLEFSGIARFLGPLLEMVYPLLIALSIWNIGWMLFRKSAEEIELENS